MVYNNNFIAVVKCRGKVLRESKEGVVRIPFGSEYSILLKNKSFQRAVVSVEINGVDALSNRKIVIDPNGSTELEGFMNNSGDVTNKFKFIEKTAEVSAFRGDDPEDGLIRITYQFEARNQISTIWYEMPNKYHHDYYNNILIGTDFSSLRAKSVEHSGEPIIFGCSVKDSMPAANCCLNSMVVPKISTTEIDMSFRDVSEDGITVPGSKSEQSFMTTTIGSLESQKYVICFQLKGGDPISGRLSAPVFVTSKIKCPSCGKKWSSFQDFCGNCGTALKSFA